MIRKRFGLGVTPGICERCGLKYRLADLQKEWSGLTVCPKCYEERHPQDFVRSRPETLIVRNPKPEPDPVYITGNLTAEDLR